MRFRGVIFDLDGTLLNTLEDLAASTNAALGAFSMPPRTVDEVRRMVGNGIGNLIRRAVPAGTDEKTAELVLTAFRAHYADHALDRTELYPQAQETLRGLKAAQIPCAVVSKRRTLRCRPSTRPFSGAMWPAPSASGRASPASRIRVW